MALIRSVEAEHPFAGDRAWSCVGAYGRNSPANVDLRCYHGNLIIQFWAVAGRVEGQRYWIGICPQCGKIYWASEENG